VAGGRHVTQPHEAWIAAEPFRGTVRVVTVHHFATLHHSEQKAKTSGVRWGAQTSALLRQCSDLNIGHYRYVFTATAQVAFMPY
jgi:hypothetical protein